MHAYALLSLTYGSYMRAPIAMVVDRDRLQYERACSSYGLEEKANAFLWPVEFLWLA